MPYHHGDLLSAIIDVAVELAREGGPDAVVMREVAKRVGVSPAAAYRHVADRDALLARVAQRSSELLVARMRLAHDTVTEQQPQGRALLRFRTSGLSYVRFAQEEPGLFRASFAAGRDSLLGEGPTQVIADDLDDLLAVGLLDSRSREKAETLAWAAMHGLAVLLVDGHLPAEDGEDRPGSLLERLLNTFAFGLLPRAGGAE